MMKNEEGVQVMKSETCRKCGGTGCVEMVSPNSVSPITFLARCGACNGLGVIQWQDFITGNNGRIKQRASV